MYRMLRTAAGAGDPKGKTTRMYAKGETYPAAAFFNGCEQIFLASNYMEPVETKAVAAAPENKAIATAPENKAEETGAQEPLVRRGPGGKWFRHDQEGNRIGGALSDDELKEIGIA